MRKLVLLIVCTFFISNASWALFSGGLGTKFSPFKIRTKSDLLDLGRHNTNGKYYRLEANINLTSSGWVPIPEFRGHFDGNGHIISGLFIDSYAGGYIGLFAQVMGGYIEGLVIEVAGGKAVNGKNSDGVGVLAGHSIDSRFHNCYITGSVSGKLDVGGIVGRVRSSEFYNCHFRGTVSGTGSGGVGGIFGLGLPNGTEDITLEYCSSTGQVTASDSRAGGLIGDAVGIKINQSYSTSHVEGYTNVGGLIGCASHLSIWSCYAIGKVKGSEYVGGLAGYVYSGTISNSYSAGEVTVRLFDGGACGHIVGRGESCTLSKVHFNSETAGTPIYNIGEGSDNTEQPHTTLELMQSSSFAGWNIGRSEWRIQEGKSYPYLSWQNNPTENSVRIAALTVNGRVFNLSGDVNAYSGKVKDQVYNARIGAVLTDPDAWASGEGNYPLPLSENTIKIVVTPSNGLFPTVYTLKIQASGFDGKGTIQAPYQIGTAEQLNALRHFAGIKYQSVCFRQMQDIDLSNFLRDSTAGWLPIAGNGEDAFYAQVDGGGYSITGFHINRPASDYVGLFGSLGSTAKISHMQLAITPGKSVTGNTYVGGIAGSSFSADIRNSGCTGLVIGNDCVGGLAGIASTIQNCYSAGNVVGSKYVGGITGLQDGTMSRSYAAGTVKGTECTGGVAGISYGKINDCYSASTIYGYKSNVGAFLGYRSSSAITNNFYNRDIAQQALGVGNKSSSSTPPSQVDGKTTAALLQDTTFASWGEHSLVQKNGTTYPYFDWQNNLADSNAYLQNIAVKGTNIDVEPGVFEYYTHVGESTTVISITAYPEDERAFVVGNGTYENLLLGDNVFTIRTASPNGLVPLTYKLTVNRSKSNKTLLKDIKVSDGVLAPNFNSAITSYTVQLADTARHISINGIAAEASASVTGNVTNAPLRGGDNVFVLHVTAEDGVSQSNYTVTVNRRQSANANLKSITVDHGELSPTFNPEILGYDVVVSDTVRSISLQATPEHDSATVVGEVADFVLQSDTTLFVLETQAENGAIKNYHVTVYKISIPDTTSINTDLESLTVSKGNLSPAFRSNVTSYTVVLGHADSTISITGVAADAKAYVTGNKQNAELHTGDNIFIITVFGSNGATKTYAITVTRAKSAEANLKNIVLSTGSLTPAFQAAVTDYTVQVAEAAGTISFAGIPADANAHVEGNKGNVALRGGDNTFTIQVTSEDSSTVKSYYLTVVRTMENNANLLSISASVDTLQPEFNPEVLSYVLVVNHDTTQVSITASALDSRATVEGSVTNAPLSTGVNTFPLMVTSPGGTQKEYKVFVFRRLPPNPTDSTLSAIILSNGTLTPDFNPNGNSYTVNVDEAVDSISITGVPTSSDALVVGNVNRKALHTGNNEFNLIVASGNASYNRYHITVVRPPSTNANLAHISLSEGSLTPEFSANVTEYTVALPNQSTQISITGTTASAAANLAGNVSDSGLHTGINTFELVVNAEDGVNKKTYSIAVNRAKSSNAYLAEIVHTNGALTPNFHKDNQAYVLTIVDTIRHISLSGITENEGASVDGNMSNFPLPARIVPFSLKVNSEDGTASKTYVITVVRQKSSNAWLGALTAGPGTLCPAFHPDSFAYTVALPFDSSHISIKAVTQDPLSLVTGCVDSAPLHTGQNVFTLTVWAEAGNTQTYTISVNRERRSAVGLSNIALSSGELLPFFHTDTLSYRAYVADTLHSISITATPLDDNSYVDGNVVKATLHTGSNHFPIRVYSHDTLSTLNYSIEVIREKSGNAALSTISISSGTLTPVFRQTQYAYAVQVPNSVETISITGIPVQDSAKISGNIVNAPLKSGKNTFVLTVVSEDGNATLQYTIHVLRDKSSNANLKRLTVSPGSLSPTFKASKLTYDVSVSNSTTTITINAETEDATAKIIGNYTNLPLNKGINIITVTVLAESDTMKTYTLNVKRAEKSSSANLRTIVVNGDEVKKFKQNTLSYSVQLYDNNNIVSVYGVAEDEKAKVSGNVSNVEIKKDKTFKLNVTSEDGSEEKEYKVKVYEWESLNAYLSRVEFTPGDNGHLVALDVFIPNLKPAWLPNFDAELFGSVIDAPYNVPNIPLDVATMFMFSSDKYQYLYLAPHNVEKLHVRGYAEDEDSKVRPRGGDSKRLKGLMTTFRITVIAESGMSRIYSIHAVRAPEFTSSNADLRDIELSKGNKLQPTFDKDKLSYDVVVDKSVTKISVEGKAANKNSLVLGNVYNMSIKDGTTTIPITVLAEDFLTSKIYKVNVIREKSDNAMLKNIMVSDGVLSPTFDPNVTKYTVNVPHDVDEIAITGVPQHNYGKVTGNQTDAELEVGLNHYTLVCTSENDLKNEEYHVIIHRAKENASSNAKLDTLIVSTGTLVPSFDPTVLEYSVTLPYTEATISISAKAEHADALVSGTVTNDSLSTGDNDFPVTVTAEDGSQQVYTIAVYRGKSSNANLSEIKLYPDPLALTFHHDTLSYTIEAPNYIINATVLGIPEDVGATVLGHGIDSTLAIGNNPFELIVNSEDSSSTKVYTVNIVRAKSPNARLQDIKLSDGTLDPDFSEDILKYETIVSNRVNTICITGVPADTNAVVEGNVTDAPLRSGANEFVLKVTSEDGQHVLYDTIVIVRAKSGNADLESIEISEGRMLTSFIPEMTEYWATVDAEVDTINIRGIAADTLAKVTGDTTNFVLSSGVNIITLNVEAENGDIKVYTLSVYKPEPEKAPTNNELKMLKVSVGNLSPEFSPVQNFYTVSVESGVQSITIAGVAKDKNAIVTGNTLQAALHTGVNRFELYVIPQQGEANKYTVLVTRAASTNNKLAELLVSAGEMLPAFNPDSTEYTVHASNSVTRTTIVATAEDALSVVQGEVRSADLEKGDNLFPVVVTAESGASRTYTMNVVRAQSSNALLQNITLSAGELQPGFKPASTDYLVVLADTVSSISITGVVEDTLYAQVTGNVQDYPLQPGDNYFTLTVTAENGSTKEYHIDVYLLRPQPSWNNYLQSIEISVGELNPAFDANTTAYTVNVADSVEVISIIGIPADSRAVVFGNITQAALQKGNNIFELYVVAANGETRTYTVTVVCEGQPTPPLPLGPTDLSSITVSSGMLYPEFQASHTEYVVIVSDTLKNISISAVPFDPSATVSGGKVNAPLSIGHNVFPLTVTANDSTKVYTVTVFVVQKAPSTNSYLRALEINPGTFDEAFDPLETSYFSTVASNVNAISITGHAADIEARVIGNVDQAALQAGVNAFEVVVIAEAGNTRSYTVTVEREKASNTYLKNITVSQGDLSPAFHKDSVEYEVAVSHEVARISVHGDAEDSSAKVAGNVNDQSLQTGENMIPIVVSAENGDVRMYSVTVIRASYTPSTNANLADIVLTAGALDSAFSPMRTSYTVNVASNVSTISIFGYAEDGKAAINGNIINAQLSEGKNLFTLTVVAEAGNVKTYTVTVVRESIRPLVLMAFTMNSGAELTPFPTVSLLHIVTQGIPTHVMAGEHPNLEGAVWQSYTPANLQYTFANTNAGKKVVYTKLKNEKGETPIFSDSIYYKTRPEKLPVTEESNGMSATVYPNPARDIVNVDLGSYAQPVQVTLYSPTGVVYTKQKFGTSAFNIDLSPYPSGILLLKIYDNERYVVKQLIKP